MEGRRLGPRWGGGAGRSAAFPHVGCTGSGVFLWVAAWLGGLVDESCRDDDGKPVPNCIADVPLSSSLGAQDGLKEGMGWDWH